jgi:hypothetical protein
VLGWLMGWLTDWLDGRTGWKGWTAPGLRLSTCIVVERTHEQETEIFSSGFRLFACH